VPVARRFAVAILLLAVVMTSMQESPTGSTEGEVLRQWDARIHDAGDPLAALAELLCARQAARSRLFDLVGTTVLGCSLKRVLGAGGMGVTYAGIAPDGSPVAVKLVAAVAQTSGERFEQECRLLQELRHVAIVSYRDHTILEDGTGVLVMDRVDGTELEILLAKLASPRAEDIQNNPALAGLLREIDIGAVVDRGQDVRSSPRYRRRMLRLLAEVADGLHAAHEQGVIHRDVKPANILVDDDLSPVLIDFGLARDVRNKVSFTHSGVAMGTLAYMAPEQLGRDPGAVDRRADIFALGLILYRAVTGQELRQEVGDVIKGSSRSFLLDGKQSRALPLSVQAILYSCLDPRPDRRYASAADLAADLRAAAGDGTVRAQRPNALQRALRDRRKLAALAVVTIGASSLIGWHQWPRGRFVQFAATCDAADATVRVDGGMDAWLLDPVWLPYGTHAAQLVSKRVVEVASKFEVKPGDGVQWVPFSTHEKHPADLWAAGAAPVLFSTGHTWLQMSPDVPIDQRFVDGKRIFELSPAATSACVLPGRHELRVVDGKGREETQSFEMGTGATDVQLLPAWMSDIEGSYRRTWSTVLSPRMPDLELETDAETWLGTPGDMVYGFGMRQTPCALVPGSTERPARVRLRVNFGRGMRSAVVLARGERRSGGQLDVEVAFEGQSPRVWPLRSDGSLEPRIALQSDRPANWLELRATFSSAADASTSLALAKMLSGVQFGGHWKDEPPCFSIVADEGDRARLLSTAAPSPLQQVPEWTVQPLPQDVMGDVVIVAPRLGPNGAIELWSCMSHRETRGGILEVREWPSLRTLRSVRADVMHPRKNIHDGAAFAAYMATIEDADGDGWQEMLIGDLSSQRLGPLESGSVARLASREDGPVWLWPDRVSKGPFQDDNNALSSGCGDWNGDGVEDVVCTAQSWWTSPTLPKSGRVCVVDGATGRELWGIEGTREQAHLACVSASGAKGTPHCLLLRESWEGGSQDWGTAFSYSVWSGGVGGSRTEPLVVSVDSQARLVPSRTRSGAADVVLCRIGAWQDGFSGVERYGIKGSALQLLIRRELGLRREAIIDHHPVLQIIEVDDLDADGERDLAVPLLASAKDGGVVFLSAQDLRCLGRARVPASSASQAAIPVNHGTWIPGGPDRKGALVFTWPIGMKQSWGFVEPGK